MRLEVMVSGWMTTCLVTISPGRPVIEAYALMAEHGIHHLPVLEGERLVGILSDRDLHRAAPLWKEHKPRDLQHLMTPVADVMTKQGFVTIDPLAKLSEAAKRLVEGRVNSLPVLDGDRVVGILTSHDILRAVMGLPRAEP